MLTGFLLREGGEAASDDEKDDQDDEKYADEADMAGQKVDQNKRITVRNLRCEPREARTPDVCSLS